MRLCPLYLITDRQFCEGRSLEEMVSLAIEGGARLLQYREKVLSKKDSYDAALHLRELTRTMGVTFIINDDCDLALAVDADGLHIGQEDLPLPVVREILTGKIIGVSVHTVEEAERMEKEGADYLSLGPVFTTRTKVTRPPIGVTSIRAVRERVTLPLYVIGGITLSHVREMIDAGADGVAVISAVWTSTEISRTTSNFLRAITGATGRG